MKKVFVVGGTGLLGYHTTLELVAEGYQVSTISLPPAPAGDRFVEGVEYLYGDIQSATDDELRAMLTGVYGVMYAAGADERVTPDIPAAHFFYQQNALPTQRLARLAREAGVKKFVVYGSYFSHFAEQWTDLDLSHRGPYPRTRLIQEQLAYLEGEGAMDVTTLRLPWIFGLLDGVIPLWDMMVAQVLSAGDGPVPVGAGATAMVTTRQVAQSAIGAMERGTHGTGYPISGHNMSYADFNRIILEEMGGDPNRVQVTPLEYMKPAMEEMDRQETARGKEHGIHLGDVAEAQARDAGVDPALTQGVLGFKTEDIPAAIRETIQVCLRARGM